MGERLPGPFEIAEGLIIPVGRYDWVRYRAEVDIASQRLISGRVSWWFGPFYDGDVSELSTSIAINPSDLVTLELSATRNAGTLPWGRILQEVLGSRVRMNFSSDLQLSVFGQYERESGEFGMISRLRWTFDPMGELFVIYNYNALDEELGGWRLDTSQLLVKVQYALRY